MITEERIFKISSNGEPPVYIETRFNSIDFIKNGVRTNLSKDQCLDLKKVIDKIFNDVSPT